MNIKKVINKILLPLNILGAAIGLINLADDIVPAAIKVSKFLRLGLDIFERIRDFLFYPFDFSIKAIIGVEIPEWPKSYLFVGSMLYFSMMRGIRKIDKHIPSKKWYKSAVSWHAFQEFLYTIIVWPFLMVLIVRNYKRKHDTLKFYQYWGNNLIWIIIAAIIIVFTNWLWIRITLSLETLA